MVLRKIKTKTTRLKWGKNSVGYRIGGREILVGLSTDVGSRLPRGHNPDVRKKAFISDVKYPKMERPTDITTTVHGHITDPQFNLGGYCLVFAVDAVSVDPRCCEKYILETYPRVDLFSSRRRLYTLNRAVRDDRAKVGSIFTWEPSDRTDTPHLVAMVANYLRGPVTEPNNDHRRYIIENSRDYDLKNGVINDTSENRIRKFKDAMESVVSYVKHHEPGIRRVIIPVGIGCEFEGDRVWTEYYLPRVQEAAFSLKPYSIELQLVDSSRRE